jgi:hypothetical protein
MAASRMDSNRGWWEKPLLTMGFLTFTGALLLVYNDPATGYELSLYRATPETFWVGIGIALLAALGTAFVSSVRLYRSLALILAGCAVFTIAALPVIRGYYYYGIADPLTHLGLVKDLARGITNPFLMIYPGLHTLSIFINRMTGYPFTRSLLLVVLCFVILYFVFVPLCVRLLATGERTVAVGAFSAFLLLPINHVSTHLRVHPFSLTVLYSSLVVFLLLKVFLDDNRREQGENRLLVSPSVGILLALALVLTAAVLYHSQQALNLLILFVTVCGIQFIYRRFRPGHPITNHTTIYPLTTFFLGVYTLWTVRTTWFFETASKHLGQIFGYITGDIPIAGERVQSQGSSLSAVGGSLPEIFFKLFFLSAVYTLLAGIVILLTIRHSIEDDITEKQSRRLYLSVSIVPIVLVFVVYFFGSIRKMQFRHLGFVMALATILGAVGLILIRDRFTRAFSRSHVGVVIAVCFALMLPLAFTPLYQSPYTYRASHHVTEEQMEGYDFVFERQAPTVPVVGVRVQPERYSDATQGVMWTNDRSKLYRKTVPIHGLSRLQENLNGTRYVIVTEMDRQREVIAYNGFKFSRQGFRSLDDQPGVNRVMSNGEVNLYYVENESASDSRQSRIIEYETETGRR